MASEEKKPLSIVKMILLGDTMVGKSCILHAYRTGGADGFLEQYSATIGVDYMTKRIATSKTDYKLQVWDTAGQERFRNISTAYYRGSRGFILVYDITSKKTLSALRPMISNVLSTETGDKPKKCMILVGNKLDESLNREVSIEEGQEFAREYGCNFIETSAKDQTNIEEIFQVLLREIIKKDGNYKWWQKIE